MKLEHRCKGPVRRDRQFSLVSDGVLNVKALVGAFNQEKALVVIVQPVVEPTGA